MTVYSLHNFSLFVKPNGKIYVRNFTLIIQRQNSGRMALYYFNIVNYLFGLLGSAMFLVNLSVS
jgi:hypothetical protein